MKYDIRINGILYQTIEGYDIRSALTGAGMEVEAIHTGMDCGYLDYDYADILGILNSDTDRDNDEILDSLEEGASITFGPAE